MRAKVQMTLLLCGLLVAVSPAFAWGGKGHDIIGVLAAKNFPSTIPAFLRSPEAIARIGALAREPDRSRQAGQPHDDDRDPAHFIDISDDGSILGGPQLSALPPSRQDYDTALRAAGSTQYKAGWLPYAIMDGWQQLVKDFALWRADVAGEKFAKTRTDKNWFSADRRLRELLTLRDLGVWAHFVGDGSQPMHASVHYNGWGDGPNPENFTPAANFHSRFESDFVNANIAEGDVAPRMTKPDRCQCSIQAHTIAYLTASQDQLLGAFRLDQAQAFDRATPEAKTFAAGQLAKGASMLRDMTVDAWAASSDAMLGYKPLVPLKDIEAGRVDPRPLLAN